MLLPTCIMSCAIIKGYTRKHTWKALMPTPGLLYKPGTPCFAASAEDSAASHDNYMGKVFTMEGLILMTTRSKMSEAKWSTLGANCEGFRNPDHAAVHCSRNCPFLPCSTWGGNEAVCAVTCTPEALFSVNSRTATTGDLCYLLFTQRPKHLLLLALLGFFSQVSSLMT